MMETLQEKIAQMEGLGERIRTKGFYFEVFSEACQLYWDVFLADATPFSQENLKLVSADELERAQDRQIEGDYRRMYGLLPKRIQEEITREEMIRRESQGAAVFFQLFMQGTDPIRLGVYNHEEDICYIREEVPKEWNGHPNEFHAVISAHELGHRYIRKKRETMKIRGIGDAFWEEKYCGFLEAGFRAFVFGAGNTDKYVSWRREQQRSLGATLFDAKTERRGTTAWIAKYEIQQES